MSTYHDPSVAELEALMYKVHGACDAASAATQASFAKCDRGVKKLEAHLRNEKDLIREAELAHVEHKVSIIAPHILAAYEKLPSIELKLKVATFEQRRKAEGCKRLQAKHLDASKSEIRLKKANKQLTKTVESLTDQLQGKVSPQEQALKTENEDLRKQLALLRSQLASNTGECEAKDAIIMSKQQDIDYFREDFAAYQSVYEDTCSHRHDACDELVAALEERANMHDTERVALHGTISTLHHKCNTLAMERDTLQEQFNVSDGVSQISCSHQLTLSGLDQGPQDGVGGPRCIQVQGFARP